MAVDREALSSALADLDPSSLVREALDASLARVVSSATAAFEADGAGIMVVAEDQGLRFVSATDPVSAALEGVEQRTGDGPCVDALVLDEVVQCNDLSTEERWPEVREALVPLGARAILGIPLRIAGTPIGALDVYRSRVHAWDHAEVSAIRAYAEVVQEVLGLAVVAGEQHGLAEQLRHALEHRVVVERAVGYLMATRSIDPVEAFNLLRSRARSERRKVSELAEEILRGDGPVATPPG